ncbi:MAG TPA: ABC transporter substrate-binding protein [Acidimicrobiia bacterium]|nr:ABC transporter substrate-binding protein [Acidimicrobiia bacterium]
MSRRVFVSLALVFALLAAACGGDDGGSDNGGGGGDGDGAAVDAALCGLDEFAAADGPIDVTFWHQQGDENEQALIALTDRFNESQDAVRVELVLFPDYEDLFTKYRASLSGGDLPDLLVLEETTVQSMVDSQSTIPMQACIDADDVDLSDFLPRAVAYYTTEDVLRAMPWNISNPILWYDRAAFRAAGLDPDDPPETLAEVREYSQQIVDSGAAEYGIALRTQDYYNEFWYAKGGQEYVNNGNGRDARATAAQLDTDFGLELWTWWDDMVSSKLALNTGSASGNVDHMFSLANNEAAMTIEASSALGPALAVLNSGQFADVDITTAPLPGLEPGGGVPVGDGALWIVADSAPEERAAAWQFVKWLTEPEQQAELHIAVGYVPVRMSAVEDPGVQAKWAELPVYRTAYDQLVEGPTDAATAGSVIGDYQGVRDAVTRGLEAMLSGELTPAEALARAQQEADDAIASYNARVGG